MSTFSPERVLTRPASGRPLWKEGWLAAALWLLGGLFTTGLARCRAALAV